LTGSFVLDASMTVSWVFEDESTPFTVELAIREGLPLATLDEELRQAAAAAGVTLVDAA
jgi:hypothetical protein